MTDLAGVSLVLSSIKAATDIARLLKDTNLSLEKAEAKLKLAELVGALADAKIQIAEVQDILLEKEAKIKKLEERADTKKMLYGNHPGTGMWMEERRTVRFVSNAMTRTAHSLDCRVTEIATGCV